MARRAARSERMVMIGIDGEDAVAASGRQQRGLGQGEDGGDLGQLDGGNAVAQHREDGGLDVHGEDTPERAHFARQPQREVAGPGADVRHGLTSSEAESAHHPVGELPQGALVRFEPRQVGVEVMGIAVAVSTVIRSV